MRARLAMMAIGIAIALAALLVLRFLPVTPAGPAYEIPVSAYEQRYGAPDFICKTWAATDDGRGIRRQELYRTSNHRVKP